MAVQGEPEAEADPQFFYPNALPVYNNYYPSIYPSVVRTPVVQKAAAIQVPKRTAPASTTHFYPVSTFYPYPTLRYAPLIYYPPEPFLKPVKPAKEEQESVVENDADVVDARDSIAAHGPIRPIIPIFGGDFTRTANNKNPVTFLRPNQAPANKITDGGESDKLIQFRSLPYTQAHLNRIPVANFGKWIRILDIF